MNTIQEESFLSNPKYNSILEKVIKGDVDKGIMKKALEFTSGDIDKAEALYVVYTIKGCWPEYCK